MKFARINARTNKYEFGVEVTRLNVVLSTVTIGRYWTGLCLWSMGSNVEQMSKLEWTFVFNYDHIQFYKYSNVFIVNGAHKHEDV